MTSRDGNPTARARRRAAGGPTPRHAAASDALVDALGDLSREARDEAARELYARLRAGRADAEHALASALSRGDTDVRCRACDLLASAPALADPAPLRRALTDAQPEVRARAARALAAHRVVDPRTALALLALAADADPAAHVHALAALAVIAPSLPVVRAVGTALVSDRFGLSGSVRETLRAAGDATRDTAAALLDAPDAFDKRAGLWVLHASGRALDPLATRLYQLTRPGLDTHVRRAAARALGRVTNPGRDVVDALAALGRDWDSGLRVAAAVALGQLATRADAARAPYAAAVRVLPADEVPELAAALRAAGDPAPPHGPLLERLSRTAGYARLDLCDALLAPRRARAPVRGVWLGDARLPMREAERLDDAIDRLDDAARPRMARGFLECTTHDEPLVRACTAVFAAHLDRTVATAVVLQSMADADPDPGVAAVARALLAEVRATPRAD